MGKEVKQKKIQKDEFVFIITLLLAFLQRNKKQKQQKERKNPLLEICVEGF